MLSNDPIPIDDPVSKLLQKAYFPMPGKGRLTLVGVLMLASAAVGMVVVHRTRFGANVLALGGGAGPAWLRGVRVGRTTALIHGSSGFMAGRAGIVFSIYTSAGSPLALVGGELNAIAVVVIGGPLSRWWTKIVFGGLLFGVILLQDGWLRVGTRRARA